MLTDEEIQSVYSEFLDIKGSAMEFARRIERAVLAKAMQNDADAAFEAYINERGGEDSYAWHDAPVDGIFKDGFAIGRLAKAMPIPKQEPLGQNRYGLDMSYMVGKLNIMIRDIDNYKGDEAARTLLRLAKVADESVFTEPEFSQPAQAAAIPEGYAILKIDSVKSAMAECFDDGYRSPSTYNDIDMNDTLWIESERILCVDDAIKKLLSASPKPE